MATKKQLEAELADLRKDFRQLTSVVSEVFVQHKILNSKEYMNQELLRLVNKKHIYNPTKNQRGKARDGD